MKWRLMKSEVNYHRVLEQLDKVFHAKPGTDDYEELEMLVMLIEKYENDKAGEFPDPSHS